MAMRAVALAAVLLLALAAAGGASAATLALYNRCGETVWPGIQPSAGKELLARGGMQLAPGHATSIRLPAGWSGRVWGRQECKFDAAGRGRCATGDCGGTLYCNGAGGAPPATLAEITLGSGSGAPAAQDFYDVSLVDGYNIPIAMTPVHGSGANCVPAGCVSDLNRGLAVRGGDGNRVVGCRSACAAYGAPQYCCTGNFGTPQQCKPTAYSRLFKSACPKAYSYAYDDPTSILTCSAGASYVVTFCPHRR
uniref:Thaumatin-like protein n=1 Tax=Setaria italica TaxID=4555 RepID=K3Y1N1_SETIT